MSLTISRIGLAERLFVSGRMCCIGMWCDVKLDDQSQIFAIEPILLRLWWEGGILVIDITDRL
ncbi:MAG: hypothetical protein ACO3LW_15615 [bacterium]